MTINNINKTFLYLLMCPRWINIININSTRYYTLAWCISNTIIIMWLVEKITVSESLVLNKHVVICLNARVKWKYMEVNRIRYSRVLIRFIQCLQHNKWYTDCNYYFWLGTRVIVLPCVEDLATFLFLSDSIISGSGHSLVDCFIRKR